MEEDEEVGKGGPSGCTSVPPSPPPSPPPGRSIQPPSPTTRPTTPATLLIIHSHPKSPRLIIFVIAKEKSRKPRNNVQLYARGETETETRACVACVPACALTCTLTCTSRVSWECEYIYIFFSGLEERINVGRVNPIVSRLRPVTCETFSPRARDASKERLQDRSDLEWRARGGQFFSRDTATSPSNRDTFP